jgi:hypothetical protein
MHTTKVIKTEQLTDESIAVTIRCCENAKTDSVLTIAQAYKINAADVETMIEKHHDAVKARCLGMQTTLRQLKGLKNLNKVHRD